MIDTSKYEGHSPAPWSYTLETEDKIWDEHGAVWDKDKNCLALVGDGSEQFPDADLKLIADAPLLLAEVKRLREELFDTHAFYSTMEQKLAFAVGIKQGLLTNMTMDDLVDSMNRDYHDRLNEHMDGRLRK